MPAPKHLARSRALERTASERVRNSRRGAPEHMRSEFPPEWPGAVAFASIGMTASAFTGADWEQKHKPALKRLFTELMAFRSEEMS